jgi:hypothetical protein
MLNAHGLTKKCLLNCLPLKRRNDLSNTGYGNLRERISESIQFSRTNAKIYSWIYRLTRGLIIIFSALTATITKFGPQSSRFSEFVPYLAAIVAILAALEAWLKPGVVYRAHFEFNDVYIGLETRLTLIGPKDAEALKLFSEELTQVDARYRKAIED